MRKPRWRRRRAGGGPTLVGEVTGAYRVCAGQCRRRIPIAACRVLPRACQGSAFGEFGEAGSVGEDMRICRRRSPVVDRVITVPATRAQEGRLHIVPSQGAPRPTGWARERVFELRAGSVASWMGDAPSVCGGQGGLRSGGTHPGAGGHEFIETGPVIDTEAPLAPRGHGPCRAGSRCAWKLRLGPDWIWAVARSSCTRPGSGLRNDDQKIRPDRKAIRQAAKVMERPTSRLRAGAGQNADGVGRLAMGVQSGARGRGGRPWRRLNASRRFGSVRSPAISAAESRVGWPS